MYMLIKLSIRKKKNMGCIDTNQMKNTKLE